MAGPFLWDIFSEPSSWQIRLGYEFSQSKRASAVLAGWALQAVLTTGPKYLEGKSSERQSRFSLHCQLLHLANKYFISVCLFTGLAGRFESFARQSFRSTVWITTCVFFFYQQQLLASNLENFFSPVTTPLWNPITALSFLSVIFISACPSPSPDVHNRSTNWFPISSSVSFSCHWPIPSLRMSSAPSSGPDTSSASPPLITRLPNVKFQM